MKDWYLEMLILKLMSDMFDCCKYRLFVYWYDLIVGVQVAIVRKE